MYLSFRFFSAAVVKKKEPVLSTHHETSISLPVRHKDDASKGRGVFVRVEVAIVGATFCVVLSDASNFPPPFRIDNFSEVSITYYQVTLTSTEPALIFFESNHLFSFNTLIPLTVKSV